MKGTGESRGNSRAEQEGRGIRHKDHGVSEVVSIVLLLAVVVVGVGIVAVTIYSQPAPEGTPQVDILVSETDTAVRLTHNGGDSLTEGSFYVLADGVRLEDPPALSGGDWPWSIGEVLQYGVASAPGRVQVVYGSGGGAVLLKSAAFSGAAGTAGPDVPVGPTGGGYVSPSFDTQDGLDNWVVGHFVGMLANNSIYLGQDTANSGKDWICSGSFEFNLSDDRTYLKLANGSNATFVKNDVLKIGLTDKSTMRFFAIGHGGWHISATEVRVSKNSESPVVTGIIGGRIYDYSKLESSVAITTPDINNGIPTEFYVDNAPLINKKWEGSIILTSVKPANPTLMILDVSKNDPCYFVGDAEWEIVET